MRLMRNFGFAGYDNVIHPGTNGKMTEICAAMGLSNLDVLDDIKHANRKNFEMYREALRDVPHVSMLAYDDAESNNYQYIVLEIGPDSPASRDEIVKALQTENILARKYFWPGCHRMKPYRDLYPHAGLVLTNTENVARRVVVLPTGLDLPLQAIDAIAAILRVMGAR